MVGTELSGLVYAAMAARHGYRVGVIGQGRRPQYYRVAGHVFLREHSLLYGLSTSPIVGRAFTDLALGLEIQHRPQRITSSLQCVMPSMRLDLATDHGRWEDELDRELGRAAGVIRRFEQWASQVTEASNTPLVGDSIFPPLGLRASARYRDTLHGVWDVVPESGQIPDSLAALRRDPRARSVVEGPLAHWMGLLQRPASSLAVARLWTHLRAGLYRVPDGLDELKGMLIAKLRDQCGDYRPDDSIDRVMISRGRVREVRLAGRGETLSCELLVSNTDPRRFLALVPPDQRVDRFHARVHEMVPAAWRVTMNLAIRPRGIPVGMGEELVLVGDPRAPLEGDNCLWLSRPGVTGNRDDTPGPEVLVVTALVPARGLSLSVEDLKSFQAKVLQRLAELIPWLSEHLLVVDLPCLRTDINTGQEVIDPTELRPVMTQPLNQTLGLSALAVKTSYRNILLCGDSVFGGLGFEGSCLAAIQALALTRKQLKIKRNLS